MKLYLAGPMTGLPEHNFPAFAEARGRLRERGYTVSCPAESTPELGQTWEWYMRRDIALLLAVDGVAVLPGWENSRGARLEVHVAEALSMPVKDVSTWLDWAADSPLLGGAA